MKFALKLCCVECLRQWTNNLNPICSKPAILCCLQLVLFVTLTWLLILLQVFDVLLYKETTI